jgi:tRNA threonylcarbamoyl adenosine modification protein YjeE
MTRFDWQTTLDDVEATRVLAQVLALKLRAGDTVGLSGDLGAGKSTFARALIRALAMAADLDVPSPTFALMQPYATPRFAVRHYDAYRLSTGEELAELGFFEDAESAVSLIEWPERVQDVLPEEGIELALSETGDAAPDERLVRLMASGGAAERMRRAIDIWDFLRAWLRSTGAVCADVQVRYMQGDASARSYAHVTGPDGTCILMDSPEQPDGPPVRDGLPYSRLAHLAENIEPFIAIGVHLETCGLAVPATQRVDPASGLALIEDLGEAVFGAEITAGQALEPLYRAAVEVLLRLRSCPVTEVLEGHGCRHVLPSMDAGLLHVEAGLLLDWFAPYLRGARPGEEDCAAFHAVWQAHFARLGRFTHGWVLRDFHSPNLIWRPERDGLARVGVIDYQDAVAGHPASDLVSLLQDARLDVPAALETELLDDYLVAAARADAAFESETFRWAYAVLGAQRNTKILGIFARLAVRDGKPQYLRHIPRISGYLERNLRHPELADVRQWFGRHLPEVLEAG